MRLQRLEGARRALVAMRARSMGMHPSATGSTRAIGHHPWIFWSALLADHLQKVDWKH
jgi:hypothetical protein